MAVITLDLETSSLDWTTGKILLEGYRVDHGELVQRDFEGHLDRELLQLLKSEESILRGHNVKFDALFLSNAGYNVRCHLEDTRVMAYHCFPELESHGLKELVKVKLGKTPTELGDILFKPLKKELGHLEDHSNLYFQIDDQWVRKDYLKTYHRADIENVDLLRDIMTPTDWFTEVEMPLTKMIFEMELYGCPLDVSHLERLKDELDARATKLYTELGGGEEFNPGSTPQIAQRLETLGYNLQEILTKTDKGAWQVDKAVLKKLSHKGDKFATTLLEFKRVKKNLSTYIDPFIEGSKFDQRLHGSFNQAGSEDAYGDGTRGTATGRLSSSSPNLQNIPARTKEGKEVRKAFIAPKGEFMFDSDLKQIEPRLIGHYSQSPKLIHAYNNGLDTHGLFACDIFDKPNIADLSPIERFIGKTSWLATTYGCSYRKLLFICQGFSEGPLALDLKPKHINAWGWLAEKERNGIYKREGKDCEFIYSQWMYFKDVQDAFWKKNPEIKLWREGQIARTKRLGYIVTYGGRILRIPGLDSLDFKIRAIAERKCINFTIQPSAADIFKLISLEFQRKIVNTGKGRAYAFVHDEILGSLRNISFLNSVQEVMEQTCVLRNIPIESDTRLIENWGSK